MRLLLPALGLSLLAACGTTPAPVAAPATPVKAERGGLLGLDAAQLAARLGPPRLTVREGAGTKLQYTASACVLDAYLYPLSGGSGTGRVAHVDTRDRNGHRVDPATCLAALER